MAEARPEEAVVGVRRSAETGLALAADCYRDPGFFELELDRVLRPGWHAIARWDDLPRVGDHAPVDLFGEPVVVVRGEDEALHVYSNVCRHRAHTIVQEPGHAQRLVCPYHRWAFGLDGSLRAAPLMEGTRGFDRESCRLPELRTESWQGFLFVSLSPDPMSLSSALKPLDERLSSAGLAEMVRVGVLDFESPWNWKVMVDNFMESYHHLGIHVGSLQKTNPAKETHGVEVDGPFSMLENPGVGNEASFLVAQVFPTLLFSVVESLRFGVWYEMQIDRHDHFDLRIHAFAAPEIARADGAPEALMENLRTIHVEDISACRAVQQGLASRLWQPGPLNEKELCLTRFYRFLAERIGDPHASAS